MEEEGNDLYTQLKRDEESLYEISWRLSQAVTRFIERVERSDHPLKKEKIAQIKEYRAKLP